jgi:hypothetical protein
VIRSGEPGSSFGQGTAGRPRRKGTFGGLLLMVALADQHASGTRRANSNRVKRFTNQFLSVTLAEYLLTRIASEHTRKMGPHESEATSNDHLDQQMIGALSNTDTNAKVKFPVRTKVVIDGRKELLLLQIERIESCNGPIGTIVFEAAAQLPREIVAEFKSGRKANPLVDAGPMKRSFQSGIET